MRRKRSALFKGRHFESEMIVLCVRWYLRFGLSFRDLEEMMVERSVNVDHVTIWRWVQRYAPELNRRCRPEIRQTNRSWRVDETYIRVAGNGPNYMLFYRGCGFDWRHDRFPAFTQAGCRCCQTLLSEGIAITGPSAASRDQCGREPVLSEGNRRTETTRRIEPTVPLSPGPLSEQHRRAGSPVDQTTGASQSGLPITTGGAANDSGDRNDKHDPQRPGSMGTERRYCRASCVRFQLVRRHRPDIDTKVDPSSRLNFQLCNTTVPMHHCPSDDENKENIMEVHVIGWGLLIAGN